MPKLTKTATPAVPAVDTFSSLPKPIREKIADALPVAIGQGTLALNARHKLVRCVEDLAGVDRATAETRVDAAIESYRAALGVAERAVL
ncbi:MAG: hypothetical protein AB7U38_14190, partial [Hyphomicrobiales bacterium]